jgi:hypothetical protein
LEAPELEQLRRERVLANADGIGLALRARQPLRTTGTPMR